MKDLISFALLLVGTATTCNASGKLDFGWCERDIFGEMHCSVTATRGAGDLPLPPPDRQSVDLASISAIYRCTIPGSEVVGTRAHRRCSRTSHQWALVLPIQRQ